jgi:predicted RNA-binding Zn ribbon-like protein
MVMTRDERLAKGLDNAETVEAYEEIDLKESKSLLEKAVFCFEQAKDAALASRAKVHQARLSFQLQLLEEKPASVASECKNGEIEGRAAQFMEQFLSEILLSEAQKLCRSILPFL